MSCSPWQSAQLGGVGDAARQGRPVHALLVEGVDSEVAPPARRGQVRLVDGRGGVSPVLHVVGAVAIDAAGGLVQPHVDDGPVVDALLVQLRRSRDGDVPVVGDRLVPVAPGARRGDVPEVDGRGGHGRLGDGVGAVAVDARGRVADRFPAEGEDVAALRVGGRHLGVAAGAVDSLESRAMGHALDVRVAVGAGDVRVHGLLVEPGIDVEGHPGEMPPDVRHFLRPSGRHVGGLLRGRPAEDPLVAVAVEALPVVQRGGRAGEQEKDRQGEERREEGPERTPAHYRHRIHPLFDVADHRVAGSLSCLL